MKWIWIVFATLAALLPAIGYPVSFGDSLNAKFHNERCLSCHQFFSQQNNGRSFNSHRSRYLCSQCHRPEVIGLRNGSDWHAPLNLDFTGMNARQTCEFIKKNVGFNLSGKKMLDHLLLDGRVRWAIESGMTPGGPKPVVPGGYEEWEKEVRAWVGDGMKCD
jgi:hypothetical protein